MAWTSYELYDALDLCDRLEEDRDQRACYSGVFMENVVGGLSGTMGHFTDYLSDDDPHYPCNALTQRYVGPCYLYHSTRMLILFDYDYGRVAGECANAHPSALYDCFESYGRDVAAETLGDPKRGLSMCQDTVDEPTHRSGASRDLSRPGSGSRRRRTRLSRCAPSPPLPRRRTAAIS